jgi:glycosyltransferase involved in cell wall biosynthesis
VPRHSQSEIWIAANTTWNLFNFRAGLIRALLNAGYRVTAFSPKDKYVEQVKALGVRHVHLPLDNSGTNPAKEALTVLRLYNLLRRSRPSLLLTFTPKPNIYGSIAAARLGISVISNVAGLGRAFVEPGWLNMVSRVLYRVALRHPARIFFQNRDDVELFLKARLVERGRIDLLPGSGVDVERFTPAQKKESGLFVFLFVGRLLADKGVREFVGAARMLRPEGEGFECRILGFIDERDPSSIQLDELRQWEAEGVVRYLGGSDRVADIMADADCVVLPTYYREGCPRSLLEASAMAIPTIAADSTGCRDIVTEGENGFLCRPRDVSDLANKMRRMLNLSFEQRGRMGLVARKKVLDRFDEKIVIARYLTAVKEVLGETPPPLACRISTSCLLSFA